MSATRLTDEEIKADKTNALMNLIAKRASFYRANPQRFVKDFFGIHLKLFQQILIWAMMHYDAFYFIAARGIGKTYLVSLFSCVRCILYPGSKIIACSYTFKQGKEIVLKITDDFMQHSPLLRNEIAKTSVGQNDCAVYFKNGSWIRVVVAGESSRGARANILLIDESRMVEQKIVDTVLRPMNASPRQPGYLRKPEYSHLKEMNKEMYMSSAYYAASEMFEKVKAFTANMLDPNLNYFVCDLPYMLSIMEGLLMRQQIENEMSEATFSDISFSMEREGIFYGSSEDALFDYNVLRKRRVLEDAIFDLEYYKKNNIKIPEKLKDEVRVLSVDIALLASKKHDNDNSALAIHCAIPTPSHYYLDNISHLATREGLVTEDLGLLIMRYYYQYNCDYIAIDANGVGQSVLDFLMADRYDPMYGQMYGALDCIDSPELSERCKVRNAPKVIYAIKANAKSNNDMALALRAGFQNGYINLLLEDTNIEDKLSKIRGYKNLSDNDKDKLKMPYIQTSMLINELINLMHDTTSNGLIRVKERPGMRKDRYSSIEYGYYVVQELGKKLKPHNAEQDILNMLTIRPAKKVGSF